MNQLSLLDAEPTDVNVRNRTLATLMARWLDALARKESIPVKNREARIDADTVAYDIEREINEALEGRIPVAIFYRNEFYILQRHMLFKAELINLEDQP